MDKLGYLVSFITGRIGWMMADFVGISSQIVVKAGRQNVG